MIFNNCSIKIFNTFDNSIIEEKLLKTEMTKLSPLSLFSCLSLSLHEYQHFKEFLHHWRFKEFSVDVCVEMC